MNRELLLKIAERLDSVPAGGFDYTVFVDGEEPLGTCGTVGCALGWAATMPEFNALGLSIKNDGRDADLCAMVNGREESPFRWAQCALEISFTAAHYLFDPEVSSNNGGPGDGATPAEVAAHIRAFVERGGMPR